MHKQTVFTDGFTVFLSTCSDILLQSCVSLGAEARSVRACEQLSLWGKSSHTQSRWCSKQVFLGQLSQFFGASVPSSSKRVGGVKFRISIKINEAHEENLKYIVFVLFSIECMSKTISKSSQSVSFMLYTASQLFWNRGLYFFHLRSRFISA